jgi:DNA-directed RNA polymerase specialized sigma24 family protein
MTLTHRSVPVEQPPPQSAPNATRTHQNQVLGELLHRCAQHDEAGLARLYELTSPFIYALVTRLTSSASVADNAMVATYAKVWREAARHDGEQSILAWMTTIAGEETRTIQAGSQPQNTALLNLHTPTRRRRMAAQ